MAIFENVLLDPLIVLLVRVSDVARPTKVSVEVGKVKVPVLTIEEMTGAVKVLFVRVWVVAVPTKIASASGTVKMRVAPAVMPDA